MSFFSCKMHLEVVARSRRLALLLLLAPGGTACVSKTALLMPRDGGAGSGAPHVVLQGGGSAVAFQADVAHSGNQTASTLAPPLTRAWSVDFGGSAELVSYPLIVDRRVFVTTSTHAGAVSTLRALDLATGNVIWGPVVIGVVDQWSNAAYDSGRVYVVVSTGFLTAFDAASGATLWSTQLPDQNDFSSPPTAAGGMVYLGGTGLGGTVYGIDGGTGTVVWTASVVGGDASSPALSADAAFVSYAGVQAYAFSRSDGAPIWHHDGSSGGTGGATPALWQGRLWARAMFSSNVVLDATSGAQLGSFSTNVIPAFADQRGFFLVDGTLRALDITALTIFWSFAGDGALVSAPLVVNGVVYVGSSMGQLYALDPMSGAVQWSDALPWGVSPPSESGLAPAAGMGAGGNALVVPAGNHLVCYR